MDADDSSSSDDDAAAAKTKKQLSQSLPAKRAQVSIYSDIILAGSYRGIFLAKYYGGGGGVAQEKKN